MTYENEGQFDRAIKRAIRNAGIDPGNQAAGRLQE